MEIRAWPSIRSTRPLDTVDAGDGVLSLREALALADATAAADTILFADAVQGQTIVLAGSQLTVNSDVTIDGGSGRDDRCRRQEPGAAGAGRRGPTWSRSRT